MEYRHHEGAKVKQHLTECEHCKLVKKNTTHNCYMQTEDFIVVECRKQKIPLVILWKHAERPPEQTINEMGQVCYQLFGQDSKFRGPRNGEKHFHLYVVKCWLSNKKTAMLNPCRVPPVKIHREFPRGFPRRIYPGYCTGPVVLEIFPGNFPGKRPGKRPGKHPGNAMENSMRN